MDGMNPTFVGRKAELAVLEESLQARESGFVPIYGRRRVGKSELILQFMGRRPGLYFLGKKAPADLQIREFLQQAASLLEEPLLADHPARTWRDALAAVTDRWKSGKKLILVFDEFQWTAGASPELPSVLQEFWDCRWSRDGSVLLILCGSLIGFMVRDVLGRSSPLFGRRTAQILLRPLSFREAAQFQPGYSLVDRARTYFVCGGIPLYLKLFTPGRSVEKNIEANLLDEFAPLHHEPDFLVREELREVENYYAVLLAVASGNHTGQAIARETGIDQRAQHYYLKNLLDLGYLARRYPLTGKAPGKRHGRYVLDDPLLRFWFRFVYPNTSVIQHKGGAAAFQARIRPELEAYFGLCFERLCREALPALYNQEGVNAAFEIGEYWDRNSQFDVVGFRDDGWTDLGECKWGTVRSAGRLLRDLEAKVPLYPNPRNATVGLRVFTRNRLKTAPSVPNASLHCLEDLYAGP